MTHRLHHIALAALCVACVGREMVWRRRFKRGVQYLQAQRKRINDLHIELALAHMPDDLEDS